MRFRFGLLLGLGTGYYYGAKAGHARYEQLNEMLEKARRSEAYETATEKARAVVDITRERAKDFVDEHKGDDDEVIDLGSAATADPTGHSPSR